MLLQTGRQERYAESTQSALGITRLRRRGLLGFRPDIFLNTKAGNCTLEFTEGECPGTEVGPRGFFRSS